ncbi:unnamed protein product [Caenorhabditis sp. 36 PRJEB53466]|nr:unnamed protein product [Caenorhabditis sp. 36 PRJEB53466]
MRIDERGNSKGNFSLLSWQNVQPIMNKSDPKYYPLNHALDLTAIFVEAPDKDRLPNLAFKSGQRIQWPMGAPPPDMPVCGFHGELCRKKGIFNYAMMIVLCIVAFFSLVISGFTLKSRRFEKELAMIWKIDQFEVRRVVGSANNESTASLLKADVLKMTKTKQPWWSKDPCYGSGMRGLASYKGTLVGLKDLVYGRKPKDMSREAKKELRAMRQLAHPNVNNFLGIIVNTYSVTVVREYCSKGSLHDILRNENLKLDHMYVASFVDDLVKGMCYIHDSEIKMHGNLKTTNCLITSRWTVQIADFGLREARDSIMFEGSYNIWENFLWTAPEAMTIAGALPMSLDPTPKADVYSFGIIFHEIVTREGPYKIYVQRGDVNGEAVQKKDSEECRELVEKTVRRVYSDPYFRPDTSELEVQNYVKEVMAACWHHDPSHRPESTKQNIMDHMVLMMEKYQTQLEDLVDERTIELKDEQQRSQHLLQRMLPSSVAEQLLAGKDVVPEAFPPVTIYFSDIVGFTTISGESTPMEVVTFLNKLYTLFDSIIRRYDVYKVETIGDAYMVVSGVPRYKTSEYHAEQIAMMAIHILSAVRSFIIPHRSGEQLMIRIGMHTGPCVAGVVGKTMPRYTLFGDTVNTASRMESNGEALRIHCSSSTRDVLASIDDDFLLEERGTMAIKGKGQMTTYWLNGRNGYEFTETIEDKMVVPDIFPRPNLKNRGSSWGVNRDSLLSLATEKSSQLMKRQSAALVRNQENIYYAPPPPSSNGFTSRGTSSREMPRLYEEDRESINQSASLFGGSSKRKKSTTSKYNGFSASRIFASTISNASSTRPSRQATFEHDTLALRKRSTSLPDGEKLNLEFIEAHANTSEPSFRRASVVDACSSHSESPSQSQYPSYRDLTTTPHQRKRGMATVFPIRKRSLSCGDAVAPPNKLTSDDNVTSHAVTTSTSPRPTSRTIDYCASRLAGSPDELVFQEDDEKALIGNDTSFFLGGNAPSSRSEDGLLRSCPQPRRKNKHSFLRDPSPLTKRFRDASPFGKKKPFWNNTKNGDHHTSSPADSISRLFRRFRGVTAGNEYEDLNNYTAEYGEEAYELREPSQKMMMMKMQMQNEEIGHGARVNRSVSCSPVEGGNSTDNSEPLLTIPSSLAADSSTTSTSTSFLIRSNNASFVAVWVALKRENDPPPTWCIDHSRFLSKTFLPQLKLASSDLHLSRAEAMLREMTVLDTVTISPCGLAALIRESADTTLIVDCRGFTEYNELHVRHSMNAFFSKLIRRRLFENKLDDNCLIHQLMSCSSGCAKMDDTLDLVLYAEEDKPRGNKRRIASCNAPESTAKIMRVLRERLEETDKFRSVMVLEGGFKQFATQYPQLCESSEGMTRLPQSLSQPCLSQPSGDGITLITPNIYLGSQLDSLDETMLKALDISAVINLSVTCPKSVCITEDKNFMRIPVNDSYQEKLTPYFPMAFEFLERLRKSGKKCLIHCLAGISRSPTLCISYIMRYMQMGSDDAYRYVKERRPSISPNFNFMGQLLEYENVLIKDHVLRPEQASRPYRHHRDDYCGPSDLCPPKVPKSASSHCVFVGSPSTNPEDPSSPSASEGSAASEPERESTVNANGKRNLSMDLGLPPRPKALGLPSRIATSIVELPSPSTELSRLSFEVVESASIPVTPILNFSNPCFTVPSSREMPTLPTPTATPSLVASSSSASSVSTDSFSSFGSFDSSSSSSLGMMMSQVENPFFNDGACSSSSGGNTQTSAVATASRCRVRGFFKVFSKKSTTPVSSMPSTSGSGSSRATRPECLRSSGVIISAPVLAITEEEDAESPESGFNEETVEEEDDAVSIASASSLEIVCQ